MTPRSPGWPRTATAGTGSTSPAPLSPTASACPPGTARSGVGHWDDLTLAVALADGTPDVVPSLAEAGVTELVIVAAPPKEVGQVDSWIADLAAEWMPTRT